MRWTRASSTRILDKLRKEGVREGAWSISRFKGLGEMNAEQLWDTTLNPDTRRLLPVQLGCCRLCATPKALITKLMGKGEAAARRELMEDCMATRWRLMSETLVVKSPAAANVPACKTARAPLHAEPRVQNA
jgi:DNA gyrase/topoisomerase IV subunit B